MFGIFANSFMTATRMDTPTLKKGRHHREDLPRLGWQYQDLPFRQMAGSRRGYDD